MDTFSSDPSKQETDSAMKWYRPIGIPVYGLDPGAPPPDYERPWQPPAPSATPVAAQAPSPTLAPLVAPTQAVAEAPPPQPNWQPQAPASRLIFPASGPAMTPEERAALLEEAHRSEGHS